jgi:hypothetical protein
MDKAKELYRNDKVISKPYVETVEQLGDNCIVFENFTASIGDLMVANCVYWRRVSGASKQIFATLQSTILM